MLINNILFICSFGLLISNFKVCNINYIQLKIIKLFNSFKKIPSYINNKFIKNHNLNEIVLVKDGNEIIKYNLSNNRLIKNDLLDKILILNKSDYDFILYKNYNNIIRYNTIEDYLNNNSYKITDNFFLKIKLILDNKEYNIKLHDPNFYIVDNIIFDYQFLEWYCLKYFKFNLKKSTDYKIYIIDNKVNKLVLNKINYLELKEGNFIVYYLDNQINK